MKWMLNVYTVGFPTGIELFMGSKRSQNSLSPCDLSSLVKCYDWIGDFFIGRSFCDRGLILPTGLRNNLGAHTELRVKGSKGDRLAVY